MREITPDEQRQVLKFITSCSNTPLLGIFSSRAEAVYSQERHSSARRSSFGEFESSSDRGDVHESPKLPPYDSKTSLKRKAHVRGQVRKRI